MDLLSSHRAQLSPLLVQLAGSTASKCGTLGFLEQHGYYQKQSKQSNHYSLYAERYARPVLEGLYLLRGWIGISCSV